MKLIDIIAGGNIVSHVGDTNTEILNICIDSRCVKDGSLFVAQCGTQCDGHLYIQSAIDNGAKAIVVEQMPKEMVEGVAYLHVDSSDKALAELASLFYGNPSAELKLIGVTGTNGKTTIATLLYRLFKNLGYKVGLISTVSYFIDEKEYTSTHTTPDSVSLNKMLREMVDLGCQYCFMEVSSHSVVQSRVWSLSFAGGVFTNLTHDHLDYHKTVANYIKAKKGFFDLLPKGTFAIYNADDRNGAVMMQNTKARKISYSLRCVADHKAKIIEPFFEGTLISIDNTEVCVRLVGRFNISNLLAIYSTALALGVERDVAISELSRLTSVSGRFECCTSEDGTVAIVDYAHTPDALKNILDTVLEVREPSQKIYTVVGCGGNRDKTKRPIMAKTAIQESDFVIITSDNPRFENPNDIISDMLCEIKNDTTYSDRYVAITDRAEAIKMAFVLSKRDKKPIIIIAGKGHEKYQEVCGVRSHFDDVEEVLKYIK